MLFRPQVGPRRFNRGTRLNGANNARSVEKSRPGSGSAENLDESVAPSASTFRARVDRI